MSIEDNQAIITNSSERMGSICIACRGTTLFLDNSIISPYLALKAWNGQPEPVTLIHCSNCGFCYYSRGLSEEEANRYYDGYRDENYFIERNHYEPFYTRAHYNKDTAFLKSEFRCHDLAAALTKAGIKQPFQCVMDYGGGEGWLIKDLRASRKFAFDIAAGSTIPDVSAISDPSQLHGMVDLLICAQVLEHVSDPAALLSTILPLLCDGGAVYIEVPDQTWRQSHIMRPGKSLLSWLCRHKYLLQLADFYSTAFRVKLGMLPPWGIVPMREHVNFFTADALRHFSERAGLTVRAQGMNSGGFFLVGTTRK